MRVSRRSLITRAPTPLLACRGEGSTLDPAYAARIVSLAWDMTGISVVSVRRSLARAGVLLDALGLFGIRLAGTLPVALRTC